MRRRPLRLAAILLLILGLSITLTSGCATTSTDATVAACPNVSCHNEIGYNQCVSAGCSCASPNDFCSPKGQKPPPPLCPVVSCQSATGYEECIDAGCGCNPRTNGCVPIPKG
jgi:hypothetical protein